MFVDTAKVELKAGKGGDGAVSFRHEIYIPKGGPDGGDGGKGGSIIFKADKDTNTLLDFRYTPILTAEDGKNGSGQRSAGRSGKDLIVEVPIGTVVYRLDAAAASSEGHPQSLRGRSEEPREDGSDERPEEEGCLASKRTLIADLVEDGQEAVIAKGGDGGFGNAHFKSSTRQAPVIAEVGEPGEAFIAELELKLLADVGLVGLPNAGKSTFLSVVSNAKPEIADYPFTTITPNLGVATIDDKDILIADIPGLIEGASEGKGLGHAFLRHVDRTAVLLHLIDAYNDDAGKAYKTIRNELDKYSDLKDRPEIVALTKCEGLDGELIEMQKNAILRENKDAKIFPISSSAHQGLDVLLRELKDACEADSEQAKAKPEEFIRDEEDLFETVSREPYETSEESEPRNDGRERTRSKKDSSSSKSIPTISLSSKAYKDTWRVEKDEESGKFIVTGEKIEKFARRTDLNNYASVNRLRDIMKKLGIRAELTTQGAEPDSIISIAGKEFTLVEDY
ncbi:GTPase ObgE [Candidatus Saccharibacteria bacterium]|nr:GTPase ObgE [Candidatus Saccharibacteria bacterium]